MFSPNNKDLIKEFEDMIDSFDMSDDYIMSTDFWDMDYDAVPPVISCKHDWISEFYFSKNVYTTCKKCGKKKEEA